MGDYLARFPFSAVIGEAYSNHRLDWYTVLRGSAHLVE